MDEQYLQDLWNWTTSQDNTFEDRYTFDSWKEKIGDDPQYQQDFYKWVSSIDETFPERRPYEDWVNLVKKKDGTTELVSEPEEEVTTSVTDEVETDGVSDVSVGGTGDVIIPDLTELEKYTQPTVTEYTPYHQKEITEEEKMPRWMALERKDYEIYDEYEINPERQETSPPEDKSFDKELSNLSVSDINKTEEDFVKDLRNRFSKYGFRFEETGMGDAIIVHPKYGKPLSIDLQTFFSNQNEFNKLTKFLSDNRLTEREVQEEAIYKEEIYDKLLESEDKKEEEKILFQGEIIDYHGDKQKEGINYALERAYKYISSGGNKIKKEDRDKFYNNLLKSLATDANGNYDDSDLKQAAYDANIEQRLKIQRNYINTLSPKRKAVAEALLAVRDAQRAGVSVEEMNKLKIRFNDLYEEELRGTEKLLNFDGTYIDKDNASEEVIAFNGEQEEGTIEKFNSYTPEELENLAVDLYYKTVFSAKKINDHKEKIYKDLGWWEAEAQKVILDIKSVVNGRSYEFGHHGGDRMIATQAIKEVAKTGEMVENMPFLPGNSPIVQQYNDNLAQLQQVQGALRLNYNPTALEDSTSGSISSPFKHLAKSAWEASTGQNVVIADDMVKAYVNARRDAGLKVTEKDKRRAQDSVLDETLSGVGHIVPLIAEIAITKKVLNLAGAINKMKAMTRYAQMQVSSPYAKFAIGATSSGLQEGMIFKATGEFVAEPAITGSGEGLTFAMGFGFGTGVFSGNIVTKAMLGTRSPMLQSLLIPIEKSQTMRSVFQGGMTAASGTGALYGAEFFDSMVNTDKGFAKSVEDVLDINGNPWKKLLVSFSTMGALGLANAGGWKNMYNAMRNDIINYRGMEPAAYKEARELLGLEENFTKEDLKKSYRNKSKETHPDKGGSKEAFDKVKKSYEELDLDLDMKIEKDRIRNEDGYKKKRRELFFMANRVKNSVELTGKSYELDFKDAETIKDLSNTELEALTEDLKKQGISGQDAWTLKNKIEESKKNLNTINEVGISDPVSRKRVYDLLNEFSVADSKLEQLKAKAKTSKANEALFSEKIKQQEANVKEITDNIQKEITKAEKETPTEPIEAEVLRIEGKEPIEKPKEEVVEEITTEEVTPEVKVESDIEVDEVGEITVSGTFDGVRSQGKSVGDLRADARGKDGEIIETTNKSGDKVLSLVKETYDKEGRLGYVGVSVTLPSDSKKGAEDVREQLEAQMSKLSGGKDISNKTFKDINELNLSEVDKSVEFKATPKEVEKPTAEVKEPPATEVAEEVVVDKISITRNTDAETNRIKGLDAKAEDGQTFNLDGTTYDGGGLVVPVMSINTTQGEISSGMIAEFVEQNQEAIGDAGVVKVGVYKFPNSDQVSIDLNIVVPSENRDVALEFGRLAGQESLLDLSTFENVKTGSDGKNPVSFNPEQFRQIANSLKNNELPNVFEKPAEKIKGEVLEQEEPTDKRTVELKEFISELDKEKEVKEEKETPTTEVTEEVSKQEMEEMERIISGESSVQFRKEKPQLRKKGTEPIDEVEVIVEDLSAPDVELINKKLDLSKVESPSVKVDISDMKNRSGLRDDIDVKEVEINDFEGLPMGLTISDQLTVGDIVNPYTGNIISNNKGGIGFTFTKGNKELAWAYVDVKTARNYLNYYREIYEKNSEVFDKAWKDGTLPKGHIPVFIVKMGPDSMKSNQQVFNVLADNIQKLPKKNKVAALKALKQDLIESKNKLKEDLDRGTDLKTGKKYAETTIKNYKFTIDRIEGIIDTIKENKYKSIDEFISDVSKKHKLFTLDQRKELIGRITSGKPSVPGEKVIVPGVGKKTVPKALLEGRPKEDRVLVHLGSLMDVITEPITKDVPERHVIGVTAIDIFSEPVVSDHPNYKGGLKGQMLGVIKNTAHLKDIYPAAYGNIIEKAIRSEERKGAKTEGKIISQGLATHMGLTDIPLRGQTIVQRMGAREKLIGFLGQSFPATTWFTDPVTWERVLASDGVRQYVKKGEIVYGMTRNGDIYLNPKFRDLNTPIHEAGHTLLDYYEVNHPELFKRGMKLVEGTQELKDAIADLGDNVKARKEALATLIGNKGETLSEDKKKRFKEWLLQLWKALKAKFPSLRKLTLKEISNLTLEDFIGGALKDIFSGRAITREKVRSKERKDIDLHFRKGDNVYDLVRRLRNAGFETGKIKVFLKKEGYQRTEILKAVEVPVDILRNLPESFGDIKGGVNEGIKLYESVLKEMNKPSNRKLPMEQNLDKGIEFLKKQDAFIAEGDTYIVKGEVKTKKEMSTQQKQMIIDFEKSVGMKSSRGLRAEVSKLKKDIRERRAGEKDLRNIQLDLKLFIRKTLPVSEYKKSEVTSLISKINKANKNNIDLLMNEVFDLAIKKNVEMTQANISSILNGKYDKVEGGRLKGVKISTEAKERIDRIKSLLITKKSSIDEIQEINTKLNNRFKKLSEQTNLTDKQLDEMVDLETAIYHNTSLLLDNADLGKLNDLYTVENNLIELIERGKTERKLQLEKQHKYYEGIISDAYEDITGAKLDKSPEGKKKMAEDVRSYKEKKKKKMLSRMKATTKKVVEYTERFVLAHEALSGLVDVMSKSTGEMFGGRLQELTTDRIDEASYRFKERKEEVSNLLFDNIERIYGKNWKKKIRKYRKKEKTGANLANGDEIILSQDEAYYLYNQYKDPANHPGFETKYGENYKGIMKKITDFLKPEVKEWADWQVDVLFPELYKVYNPVYKRIHRTNMPWNSKYAGRIKREGVEMEPLDLLEANTKYATSIGGASSKMRVKNSLSIEEVNGNDMLFTYLQDMEFFAAYAEPLRDIDKIFKNKDIRNAIDMTGGKQALIYAEKILDHIAKRGIDKGGEAKFLNYLTNAFVTSRLGFNPVVGIKQLTSAIAYMPEIGIENWMKHGVSDINKLKRVWKEITDNSIYIRDRYGKDIRRTLESYSEKELVEVVPDRFGKKTIDVLMYLIKTGDKGGIMGGIPNYLYHKDNYKKKNPTATDQEAIKYAIFKFQKLTKQTQQSGDIQDKDILQLNKYLRPFMLFMTSIKQYQRKVTNAMRQLYRKTRGRASKGTLRQNLANFFMYHSLLPMFFHYIGLGLPGLLTNWDEEDTEALGMTGLLGVFNSYMIAGDVIETIRELYEGKPWATDIKSAPAFYRIFRSIADNYSKYNKAGTEGTKGKYLTRLIIDLVSLSGLPASNMNKLHNNYSKVLSGDTKDMNEDILRLMNFSDYVIEEKGTDKSNKTFEELMGIKKKKRKKKSEFDKLMGDPKKTTGLKKVDLKKGTLENKPLEKINY